MASQNNEDLLREIFGSIDSTPSPATISNAVPATSNPAAPPTTQKSAVEDILSLFGSGGGAVSSVPVPFTPTSTSGPAFNIPPSQPHPPSQPSAPAAKGYTAYDKNDLKVILVPQTSSNKPGIVLIQARFEVTGSNAATGLTFQAAVPKVTCLLNG